MSVRNDFEYLRGNSIDREVADYVQDGVPLSSKRIKIIKTGVKESERRKAGERKARIERNETDIGKEKESERSKNKIMR